MTAGRAAWIAIAAGVFIYNLLAPEGHTLSEEVDLWLDRHPSAVRLAVFLVAHHLTNDIPPRADPVGWLFIIIRLAMRRALTRPIRL